MTETRFSTRGGKPSVEIERSRSDGGRRVLMPVARVLILILIVTACGIVVRKAVRNIQIQ